MVLARGRFDEVKIEALMREHGARGRDLQRQAHGRRRFQPDERTWITTPPTPSAAAPSVGRATASPCRSWSPGSSPSAAPQLIRSAIDLHHAGNNPQKGLESVTGNEELMDIVRSMDDGNAWAVGRFDALGSHTRLPDCRVQPDSRHHVGLGQRPRQRRHSRHRSRRSARRGSGEQPARRRARVPRAREAADGRRNRELQLMMQSLELTGTGKTVAALVRGARRGVRPGRRGREQGRQARSAVSSSSSRRHCRPGGSGLAPDSFQPLTSQPSDASAVDLQLS